MIRKYANPCKQMEKENQSEFRQDHQKPGHTTTLLKWQKKLQLME
jgi:hypothetical protein